MQNKINATKFSISSVYIKFLNLQEKKVLIIFHILIRKWNEKGKIMPKIFSLVSLLKYWFFSQHFHPTIFESLHVVVMNTAGKFIKKWENFLFSCWNELTGATSHEDNHFYIDIDFSIDWKQSCCPWLDLFVYISNDGGWYNIVSGEYLL